MLFESKSLLWVIRVALHDDVTVYSCVPSFVDVMFMTDGLKIDFRVHSFIAAAD